MEPNHFIALLQVSFWEANRLYWVRVLKARKCI